MHSNIQRLSFALVAAVMPVLLAVALVPAAVSAAGSTIQSNVCEANYIAPTITTPDSAESSDATSAVIEGTGEPNMPVTILNNGNTVGATIVSSTGTFSVQIPLSEGNNIVKARTSDSCSNKDSNQILLLRNIAPQPQPQPGGGSGGQDNTLDTPDEDEDADASEDTPTDPDTPTTSDTPPNVTIPPDEPATGEDSDAEALKSFRITEPADGAKIANTSVLVRGIAPPQSVISVFINNRGTAQIVADAKGTFAVSVALAPGNNAIRAQGIAPDGKAYQHTINVESVEPDAGLSTVETVLIAAAAVTVVTATAGAVAVSVFHVKLW